MFGSPVEMKSRMHLLGTSGSPRVDVVGLEDGFADAGQTVDLVADELPQVGFALDVELATNPCELVGS